MSQRLTLAKRDFAGRTALIAGGATLIGRAVADAFLAEGANIVIADIVAADRSWLAARGSAARWIQTDVTSDEALDACIAGSLDAFGGVDFLINVTTAYIDDGLQTTRADWLRSLDISVVSGAILARKLAGQLSGRRGAIVNFSSISAHRAQAGRFVYPAAKAAVAQLTRAQALEFARLGVRVNAVIPAWTWSNVMVAMSGDDREKIDRVAGAFHLPGRIADAEEVAAVVLFLCSDAASFVTGAEVPVDGGYLALGPEQSGDVIGSIVGT